MTVPPERARELRPARPDRGARSPYVETAEGAKLVVVGEYEDHIWTVPMDDPEAKPKTLAVEAVSEANIVPVKNQKWANVYDSQTIKVRSVSEEDDIVLIWFQYTHPDSPQGYGTLDLTRFLANYVLVADPVPERLENEL